MVCADLSPQRIFPVLTIDSGLAVKTSKFSSPRYIGDPINTVRLWSALCVDEIVCLDISQDRRTLEERLDEIAGIVNESFVPLAFGGGVKSLDNAESLFQLGIEKVVIGWHGSNTVSLLENIAAQFGSQAVSCCIDYSYFASKLKRTLASKNIVDALEVNSILHELSQSKVGEIIVQCVDRDGQMNGFDLLKASEIRPLVSVPLVLLGGGGDLKDVSEVHKLGCAAACGSMFMFRGKSAQVLIGNPFLTTET